MANSPNLGIPLLSGTVFSRDVTHNMGVRILDFLIQFTAKDKDPNAPPGSPSDGDVYLVGGSPTGAWTGRALDIAYYQNGSWVFFEPQVGMFCWLDDEDAYRTWNGSAWAAGPT